MHFAQVASVRRSGALGRQRPPGWTPGPTPAWALADLHTGKGGNSQGTGFRHNSDIGGDQPKLDTQQARLALEQDQIQSVLDRLISGRKNHQHPLRLHPRQPVPDGNPVVLGLEVDNLLSHGVLACAGRTC